jgi:hypothetical protein
MGVFFNTMMKNEEDLLEQVLPIWKKYPVDKFVFYDDNSTDNSVDVINKFLPKDRFVILNDKRDNFSESHNRQRMLDFSRNEKIDYVFSIDVDELLSSNIVSNFDGFLSLYKTTNVLLYWYNVVNGSLKYYRNDPMYLQNYRSFVLPMNKTRDLDLSQWKYHTPRVPTIDLPSMILKKYGIIHLQALDKEFYAIKQLWYKHHEFVHYGHSVEFINNRYDGVVHQLNFQEKETPEEIIDGIEFDSSVFKKMIEKKGYLNFIKNNYNKELITFGEDYVK